MDEMAGQLRKTLGKMEIALGAIQEAIFWSDGKGQIQWCNRSFDLLVEQPHLMVLGKRVLDLLPLKKNGKPIPEDSHPINHSLEVDSGFHGEFEFEIGDKKLFVDISVTKIKVSEDSTSSVFVIRDITKRKIAENELSEANVKLKESQAFLVQSEKMVSLGQMAAGVAHEINNPVGFVSSNLNTVKEYIGFYKALTEKYEEIVKNLQQGEQGKIKENLTATQKFCEEEDINFITEDVDLAIKESQEGLERVKAIVLNLKNFARIDEAEIKETDINECIESTLKVAWNELKYKCEVKKQLGKLPLIQAYPGQLNQVFMNLVVNAAHAIEEKGAVIIETKVERNNIYIRVSDTGKGISPEHLSKIFDPFFTTKSVGKGTGLGLSISYGIIEKHEGEISVESKVGEGTTFTILLPIKEVQEKDRGDQNGTS